MANYRAIRIYGLRHRRQVDYTNIGLYHNWLMNSAHNTDYLGSSPRGPTKHYK